VYFGGAVMRIGCAFREQNARHPNTATGRPIRSTTATGQAKPPGLCWPHAYREGNDMNWDAIGAVAESIAALGVIASLLYLASQVRASTRAAAVTAKLESTGLLNKFIDLLIENPELNDIYMRGILNLASLDKEEYLRFSNMSLKAFWFFSAGHFQYRSGTISEDEYYEVRAVLRYWLRGQGCRDWWEKFGRMSVSPAFRKFVDAEIREIAATGVSR
jgi:hypothetical protein